MAQQGPLSGITIVDLSRILAGPYCTMLMAELGARVIKVEPPQQGDDARQYGPFKNGKSAYFASVNRGKELIALDLKSAQGREIFERLLDKADALVENFRPGTMEKLGYGWDTLHPRYPRLVYAAASGFGHTGPYSHYPAYDMVVQGLGGVMSITGHPGMPLTRIGTSIGDLGGGLFTAVALNAALLHRERTGEAQKVDVSLFDCQLALLENAIMRYTTTGEIPGPMARAIPRSPRSRPSPPATAISSSPPAMTGCSSSSLTRSAAPNGPTIRSTRRMRCGNQHQEALKDAIEGVLRQAETGHWIEVLEAAGVPCGPVNNIAQALAHPQTRRATCWSRRRPGARPAAARRQPDEIIRVRRPGDPRASPDLDADRERILRELGL